MDLRELRLTLRRHLGVCFLVFSMAFAAGVAAAFIPAKTFASAGTMVIDLPGGPGAPGSVQQANYLVPAVVTQASSQQLLARAALAVEDRFGSARIKITATADTSVLVVRGTGHNPGAVAAWVNAVMDELVAEQQGDSPIELTIIDRAPVRRAAIAPKVVPTVGAGAVAGLLMAMFAGLLADRTRHAFDATQTVRDQLGAAVLGEVPALRLLSRKRGSIVELLGEGGPPQFLDAFDEIRTNLEFRLAGANPSMIAIASTEDGVGKSTMTTALGCVLARLGRHVTVIDADLRRPSLHERLGVRIERDVASVVPGAPNVQATPQVGLEFVSAGLPSDRPADAVSLELPRLLGALHRPDQLLIIDSPSFSSGAESAAVARMTRHVILVVDHSFRSLNYLPGAVDRVRESGAVLLGVIINKVPPRRLRSRVPYSYRSNAGYRRAGSLLPFWLPARRDRDAPQLTASNDGPPPVHLSAEVRGPSAHQGTSTFERKTVQRGARWSGIGNLATQIIRIVSTIALARLLTPEVFGIVALVTVVTGFIERVLGDTGTSVAIVREPVVGQLLASSVLWFNVALGAATTLAFLAVAGPLASLLGESDAAGLIRALGCMAFINSFTYVPRSLMRREGQFKHLAMSNLLNVSVTAVASIALAIADFNEWALVLGTLAGSLVWVVVIWINCDWTPSLTFSRSELRRISTFSRNLSFVNFFGYFTDSGDRFIVGRFLGHSDLGFYGLANRLLRYPLQLSSETYREVIMPTLARVQTDRRQLQQLYIRSVGGIAFVLLPLTAIVAALSEPLVLTFLGPKWQPAADLVTIIGIVSALQAMTTTTGVLYAVIGRSDLLLRWGIISAIVTLVGYSIGSMWGVRGVALGYLISIAVLTYPSFSIPLGLIGLRFTDVMRQLTTTIATSTVSALAAFGVRIALDRAGAAPAVQLLCGGSLATALYLGFAIRVRPRAYGDFLAVIGQRRRPARSRS